LLVKAYPPSKIRNVALVGHSGAGKTTLVEALLHCSGATNRIGRVEEGNTVCDFEPEEIKRGISLSLALAPIEHDGHKINLIDTPGYADFIGDVAAGAAGYPVLLVPPTGAVPQPVKDALAQLNPLGVIVMGGTGAVSAATLASMGL
jgi:elongation factor G